MKIVLATLPGYTLPLKSTFALVKKGGTLSAWVNGRHRLLADLVGERSDLRRRKVKRNTL